MPSQNFCNPDHCSNSCVLSLHVVHQGGGLAHQGEGLVHQGQGLLHHGEGQQDPTGTLRRLPHPRHDRSILRHHSKDKTGFFFIPPISTPQVDVREPSDGQWGAQMENGSWSGVVEMTNSSNTFVDL